MGRRQRKGQQQQDDFDDSLERSYAKRSKTNLEPSSDKEYKPPGIDHSTCNANPSKTQNNSTSPQKQQQQNGTKPKDNINIERLREKKRLKKQRQKEKKLAAKKEQEEVQVYREKQTKEREKQKLERKKRKDIDQKALDTNTFIYTSMGVKYCDIVIGPGAVLQDRNKVLCQYVLRAKHKKGKVIDSGDSFSFKMGKGEVIKGWEIGLKEMRQGGSRHIIVPPKAGYGNKDIGAGKGANLYFEVNLLRCK
mmetsp:Transcript_68018/g.76150  ORF Transcript_68018/g.76150 Transcript_68018/m.76150 type:complete len:250 (-) Transcript_68018:484-1233(-)